MKYPPGGEGLHLAPSGHPSQCSHLPVAGSVRYAPTAMGSPRRTRRLPVLYRSLRSRSAASRLGKGPPWYPVRRGGAGGEGAAHRVVELLLPGAGAVVQVGAAAVLAGEPVGAPVRPSPTCGDRAHAVKGTERRARPPTGGRTESHRRRRGQADTGVIHGRGGAVRAADPRWLQDSRRPWVRSARPRKR
jgi:hypothetical protein